MQIVRQAVVETDGRRYVEIEFASDGADDPDQFIEIRVQIPADGHPRLTEALLEGLRVAQKIVGAETQRLSALRDQGF